MPGWIGTGHRKNLLKNSACHQLIWEIWNAIRVLQACRYIEQGKRFVPDSEIVAIAKYFHISTDYLFFVNFFVRITTFHQVNIKSKHRAIYFTHKKLQIPQKNGNYQYGKQDLFAAVIALRYLISSEDFKAFKSNLTKLINKVLRQCPHLTHEQLLMEMGFPENWEKIMRYKK